MNKLNEMNKNILYCLIAPAAFCLAGLPAVSQNLDPTVVVSRNYEGKLIEVHKPSLEMTVPDSVTRFDLDFDYSVFESPYKGSYEFSPYILTMRPASHVPSARKFYLRAGAGYPLHPSLDMVWSPFSGKKGFTMDVYARHRSYFGHYWSFRPEPAGEGDAVVDRWTGEGGKTAFWQGYDMNTRAGIDGSYGWQKGTFDFDVAYWGLASDDKLRKRAFNAVDFKAGVASSPSKDPHFQYDVSVSYLFARDNAEYGNNRGSKSFDEHVFAADASFGQMFQNGHKLLFDVGFDLVSGSGALNGGASAAAAGEFSVTPHYVFSKDRWKFDLGVLLSKMVRSGGSDSLFSARGQIVYPDATVRFAAIPDAMSLYFRASGGNRINSYSSLMEKNRHLDMSGGRGCPLMDNTVERVRAALGLEGRIGGKFSYDLSAGYSNYKNVMLDAVFAGNVGTAGGKEELAYLPGIGYAPYRKVFAKADFCWKTDRIRMDGVLVYNYVFGLGNRAGLFAPAAFSGDVAFEYNWSRRIFAGIDCAFATGRKGSVAYLSGDAPKEAVIPGYADLGLSFEVAVSRWFSVWLRGGNLLNMTVQRNPLYAERGISATAGICFNF